MVFFGFEDFKSVNLRNRKFSFFQLDPDEFRAATTLANLPPIHLVQLQIELKSQKTKQASIYILRRDATKLLIEKWKDCKMKRFSSFPLTSVVKFSLCWSFLLFFRFFFFTLWLQNLHSDINSGLCLLSTCIQTWNPPSFADPTFRNRSRCRCPVNENRTKMKALAGCLSDT